MPKPRAIVVPALVALLLAGLVLEYHSLCRDRTRIRARYQQMRTALSSKDTNAVLTLIARQDRSSFGELRFSRLDSFAAPLKPDFSILVLGKEATVWPAGFVFPGGNTIEMVKVAGKWYFTGRVHLD